MKVKKTKNVVKRLMVVALSMLVMGQGTEIYASTLETSPVIESEEVKETEQVDVKATDKNEVNDVIKKTESSSDMESKTEVENSTDTVTPEMCKAVFSYTICWEEPTEYYGAEGELIERPADPNLAGYTFISWCIGQDGGVYWDFTKDVMPEGGIILYAHFIVNPEQIRFHAGKYADPASLPADFIIKTFGINQPNILDLRTLPAPSLKEEYRDDYVFTGEWFLSQEIDSEIGITTYGKVTVPSGGLYVSPVYEKISSFQNELCASNIKFSVSEYLKHQKDGTLQDEILKKSNIMARDIESGSTGPVEFSSLEVVLNLPVDGTPGTYDVKIRGKEGFDPIAPVVIKVEIYKDKAVSKNNDGSGNGGTGIPKTGDMNSNTVQGLGIVLIGSCFVVVIAKGKKHRAM